MEIEYKCIFSNRKTLGLQIKTDGSLVVRAPHGCTRSQIDHFVNDQREWILKHMKKLDHMTHIPALDDETIGRLRITTYMKAITWLIHWAGVKPKQIYVRNQSSRWGSCSSLGNISLNLRCALLPDDLFEYVLVHELCHLIEMNHSPAFWNEVERILPNYKALRAQLKQIHFTI